MLDYSWILIEPNAQTFRQPVRACEKSFHGKFDMSFITQLIEVLEEEWEWFGKDMADGIDKTVDGKPKEAVKPYSERVGDYWLAITATEYNKLVKDHAKDLGKLDGTVRAVPWSAAFISYCMQKGGAGTQFPYSAGHVRWIIRSIKNKQKGKTNAALVGYKINELPLRVGDLVGAPRESGVTYNNAAAKGWFKSHTDVIVKVDLPNKRAYAIEGNVGQSVAQTTLRINSDGMLADTSRNWIFHIRNSIKLKPASAKSKTPPQAG